MHTGMTINIVNAIVISIFIYTLIPLISFICFCVHIICAFIILSDWTIPIRPYLVDM